MYSKEIKIRGKNNGYFYFIDSEHPLATGNSNRVYLHRHVLSLKEGRWLNTEEQVNHIDGNRENNSPDNLQVLSASNHTKTDALRLGKKLRVNTICILCKKKFKQQTSGQKYCSRQCSTIKQRKFEIDKKSLERLVWAIPTTSIGILFGVSDGAIFKRCQRLGVNKPPRGYWNKLYSQP